jgi:hypothetical protein
MPLKFTRDESEKGTTDHFAVVRAEFADYDTLIQEAREAQEAELSMTFKQAFRKYPKAVGWSVIISLAM